MKMSSPKTKMSFPKTKMSFPKMKMSFLKMKMSSAEMKMLLSGLRMSAPVLKIHAPLLKMTCHEITYLFPAAREKKKGKKVKTLSVFLKLFQYIFLHGRKRSEPI
jgi:hypothetical protein